MNLFIHARLHHFLMGATDGDGNDLGGAEQEEEIEEEEQETEEQEEQEEEEDPEGDLVVTIEGEEPEEDESDGKPAPKWVKQVREENRNSRKRIKELEEQLRKTEPVKAEPVLGKKPSLSDEDIDYDEEKFDQRLTDWYDKKREIEEHEKQQQKAQQQQQEAWQAKLSSYAEKRTELKAKDFEVAEEAVRLTLDETQQGIIVQVTKNPAVMIYALGKNPKKAAQLAAIKDYASFAYALGELEKDLKVANRKKAPPEPETTVRGQGRITGAVDSTLEKLREEAAKTGDNSKVMAYKRAQKAKGKG